MTIFPAALAAIDAAFAEPISYNGQPITAVWSDVPGEAFQGSGNTTRTISCEIRKSKLSQRPDTDDTLVRAGVTWRVNEVVDRDDVGAWQLFMERAA